ncbi:SDR family NAD(P)-dependent oxidoreductase [Marinibacterium profundimaris]|uniref:Oxidoreductase n=1 Tax=Marinibacterium profundimaris TaxID=1679460 RepID=A0A225NQV4_9RHOB|nr:SDR family oxidoreductase [Marinibacterium profundimaris]OWU77252.1 oxidoreductase [Marinibacterium profundimaris]
MERVALITGGARGIGRAIVETLAREYRIAFTWSTTEPEAHPDRLAIRADFTDPQAAERVVRDVIAHYGRLDVIVNNAGVVAPTPKESATAEEHRRILEVNYMAPAALLSAALPHLERGAAVVSISSVNAVLPPRDAVTYGASKAALNLWTRAMAKELGPSGIRVNAVAPGAIELPEAPRTDDLVAQFVEMTALGRPGVPEDIARAVRFLASEEAGFITGEILTVSGGYRL